MTQTKEPQTQERRLSGSGSEAKSQPYDALRRV